MLSALAESGRVDRAAQLILDRLDDDPENDNGTWMLAALLADADRREEAIELARNRLLRTSQRDTFQDFIIEQLQAA